MFSLLVIVCFAADLSLGLDNGLGKTPGMGWNSDYCVNCSTGSNGFQNEQFIQFLADTFVKDGELNGQALVSTLTPHS